MTRPEPTEIRIDERGDENHESWILIRANRVSGWTRLFDSEIRHQHYIQVTITRCTRKRNLKRDWLHPGKVLMEIDMSEAQWGAFVSSFGNGSGVPATLDWFDGASVPRSIVDSRLKVTHDEVRDAAKEAVEKVDKAYAALQEAFDNKLGVRVVRERMNALRHTIGNLPANMEYTANALTEHTEAVVQKARNDIEAMAVNAYHGQAELNSALDKMLEIEG